MSPHCVWIITVGGRLDNGYIANPIIATLTELGQYMILCIDYCTIKYHTVKIFKGCKFTQKSIFRI